MDVSVGDGFAGAAVAFALAVVTTPVGVSGAVLLLPFQASVLRVATPALTPTNLLYNVVTAPGALGRLAQEGRLRHPLVGLLLVGTLPGVAAGAVARVELLPGREALYAIAAVVLLPLGLWLLVPREPATGFSFGPRALGGIGFAVGALGGLYGIGGGSLLAPIVVAGGYTVTAVAPAALACTAATSTVGVAAFALLSLVADRPDVAPIWSLGAAMGVGGAAGSYVGIRIQHRLPEVLLRRLLGLMAAGIGCGYALELL